MSGAEEMVVAHQSTRPRMATLTLEWPLNAGDQIIDTITLRRLTGAEVAELQDRMTAGGAEADMIAAFCDQPPEVIGQLDADDYLDLKVKVVDFLPKRLREAMETATQSS